jgi:hypothetical protein
MSRDWMRLAWTLVQVRAASAFVCVFRYADDGGREVCVAHVNSALV